MRRFFKNLADFTEFFLVELLPVFIVVGACLLLLVAAISMLGSHE